ncbi:MAG TPA: hypothetical protein VGR22_11395 [Thermomicrobiales bacterium]|nr:hypothetical protein [Thermomicrobiales bacterium]
MRRLLISVSLAYLLVAFGFILLTMLNASNEGDFVAMAEADAGMIVALSVFGVLFVIVLAIRILLDGKRRHDLERQLSEPRRKSQTAPRQE